MKKILITIGCWVGLVIVAFGVGPPAHADEVSYLNAVGRSGVGPTDGNYVTVLRWGYAVCVDKNYWLPLDQTVSNVFYNPQNQLTWEQAYAVVAAAEIYLC